MEALEKKILKKIYWYETGKILLEGLLEIIAIVSLVAALIVFGQIIVEILFTQKTFDLLQLFGEDFEVVRKYFTDTVYIFYQELPKFILIIYLFAFSGLSIIILTLMKNFKKIINRVISLLKFWL